MGPGTAARQTVRNLICRSHQGQRSRPYTRPLLKRYTQSHLPVDMQKPSTQDRCAQRSEIQASPALREFDRHAANGGNPDRSLTVTVKAGGLALRNDA